MNIKQIKEITDHLRMTQDGEVFSLRSLIFAVDYLVDIVAQQQATLEDIQTRMKDHGVWDTGTEWWGERCDQLEKQQAAMSGSIISLEAMVSNQAQVQAQKIQAVAVRRGDSWLIHLLPYGTMISLEAAPTWDYGKKEPRLTISHLHGAYGEDGYTIKGTAALAYVRKLLPQITISLAIKGDIIARWLTVGWDTAVEEDDPE